MLTEAEKRAAAMAVSRYGADRAKVQLAMQSVVQAQAQGGEADLFDVLVTQKLLNRSQAHELRFSLDATQIDPASPPAGDERNGAGTAPAKANGAVKHAAPAGELRSLGDYRIMRRLGEGGMGAVYLGYHEAENRQVAIKILPNSQTAKQSAVDRFYREAKSGALLNHPNIVRNLTVGQDQATGNHYLVLEFVDGPSAQALLDRFGKLSVGDAVHIVLDIARALEHVQSRNIVHRDIKPANILITPSGLAKLADLGLAKRTDEASHLTAHRQGFGTPYYMPYEQATDAKKADARSDIYALGGTLYHLVTGDVPFPGDNPMQIVEKKEVGVFRPARTLNAEIPAALDDILAKMLARDPHDRYQTASELIVDLERSGLSAQVPSFIDRDLAMQDPLVRQRITTPAQPTAPDLRLAQEPASAPADERDLWYLRYHDRKGKLCKAKLTTAQLCRRLREGRLFPQAEVSRQPQGEFLPLSLFREFKEAVESHIKNRQPAKPGTAWRSAANDSAPGAEEVPARSSRLWLIIGVAAAGVVLAVAAFILLGV